MPASGATAATTTNGFRQTLVYVTAVLLFLVFARGGTSRLVLLLLFCGYVAAATLWVRGQYVGFLAERQYHVGWRAALLLLGLAVLAVVALGGDLGGSLLLAAILGYLFVGGFLVMRWRDTSALTGSFGLGEARAGRPWRAVVHWRLREWGFALLVSCLVAGLAGAVLLWFTPGWMPGRVGPLLLGLAIVLGPVPLALLSEVAVAWVAAADSFRRARLTSLVGLVAYVVATAAATAWTGSPWVLTVMLVLGLMVFAVTSSTMADIAAVVAVIAVLGITPAQEELPPDLDPARFDGSRVLVAFGDSYMSGEGAGAYFTGTDEGGGNQCRRSPTAWASLAGRHSPFGSLVFLACSGARSYNVRTEASEGLPRPRGQYGNVTQLAEYEELRTEHGFTPELVVLSIGGNDAGFSTLGVMCVAPGDCATRKRFWTRTLDQVQANLEATYDEVRDAFPSTPVVVIPYPEPIDLSEPDCDEVALEPSERQFISDFVKDLNSRIEVAAAAERFHYLAAMQDSMRRADLQLCDPENDGRPGVHFIGLRSVNGIADQRFNPANWAHGSFHPNERGHQAMLRTFLRWRAQRDALPADAPAVAPGVTYEAGRRTEGLNAAPCDLFDTSPDGCRPRGQKWAQKQAGKALIPAGAVTGVALGGAWLLGVGLFGWRRAEYLRRRDTADDEASGQVT
jgi:lysophospholipase L1-like esterase